MSSLGEKFQLVEILNHLIHRLSVAAHGHEHSPLLELLLLLLLLFVFVHQGAW
jgi:hypothetical protein